MIRPRHLAIGLTLTLTLTLALAMGTSTTRAAFLDFETRPNGNTPADNAVLPNPYAIEGGTVRFFFDVNGNNIFDSSIDSLPVFEAVGDSDSDPQGFRSNKNGGSDRPVGGDLGNWFLRQPDGIGVLPGPFIIDYDTTLTIDALSGEIWDIDATGTDGSATERWRVDVLNSLGDIVATRRSPLGIDQMDPSSLDSLPWTFQFTSLAALSNDVDKVRLTFIGTKTDGVGLAFNNFSAFQAVPEPGSIVLTGLGLIGLLIAGTRRRALNS